MTTLERRTSEGIPKFDGKRIAALRARLREQVARLGLTRNGVHIPAIDYEEQRAWDEDNTESNTYRTPKGKRECRQCLEARWKQANEFRKQNRRRLNSGF